MHEVDLLEYLGQRRDVFRVVREFFERVMKI